MTEKDLKSSVHDRKRRSVANSESTSESEYKVLWEAPANQILRITNASALHCRASGTDDHYIPLIFTTTRTDSLLDVLSEE